MHLRRGHRTILARVGLGDDPRGRVGHEDRVDVPNGGIRRGVDHENGPLRFHRGEVRWARQGSHHWEGSLGARKVELDHCLLHEDGSNGQEGHGHERISLDHQTHEDRPIHEDLPIREDRRNLDRQSLQSWRQKQVVVGEERQSAQIQKLAGRHQLRFVHLHP